MGVAVFVLGLIIGSFLNAVIYRLHSGESILESHSRCPHCKHKLIWQDLVPLISFFVLRRRCRYCSGPISWQYPLVELATAMAFVLVLSFPPQAWGGIKGEVELLFKLIFTCFLIIIFVYDLKHYLILDKIVFPAAALAAIYQAYQGNLGNALLGALLLAGFFGLLHWYSKGRWIGAGDIKLGIFLGLVVPFPQTLALFFLAYLLGAAVASVMLLAKTKKMQDRLPFGTFLTLAAFIAMLWGEELINWYFKLIGFS